MYQFYVFAIRAAKDCSQGLTTTLENATMTTTAMKTTTTKTADAKNTAEDDPLSEVEPPPSLCQRDIYCLVPKPRDTFPNGDNKLRPNSWSELSSVVPSFEFVLLEALKTNSFTTLKAPDLPFSTALVAQAAANSPRELLADAVHFAYASGQECLLMNLMERILGHRIDLPESSMPFDLGYVYLDEVKKSGVESALQLLIALSNRSFNGPIDTRDGLTSLDNIMALILELHTSFTRTLNGDRDDGKSINTRLFRDICLRWDHDSSCIRALRVQGIDTIPFEWKHMFCHSSTWKICQNLAGGFPNRISPDINRRSGLFSTKCSACAQHLYMMPLHCLVFVSWQLATAGCEGETLFGILACLIELLARGADPLLKANTNISALQGLVPSTGCPHPLVTPLAFAEQLPKDDYSTWRDETKLGWDVFVATLRVATEKRILLQAWHTPGSNAYYIQKRGVGLLREEIHNELHAYRRRTPDDPWLSINFSMTHLLSRLNDWDAMDLLPEMLDTP
jgi:hypothetical protein